VAELTTSLVCEKVPHAILSEGDLLGTVCCACFASSIVFAGSLTFWQQVCGPDWVQKEANSFVAFLHLCYNSLNVGYRSLEVTESSNREGCGACQVFFSKNANYVGVFIFRKSCFSYRTCLNTDDKGRSFYGLPR
jgi:hypothetical protein